MKIKNHIHPNLICDKSDCTFSVAMEFASSEGFGGKCLAANNSYETTMSVV
jgi:hypothetical protein